MVFRISRSVSKRHIQTLADFAGLPSNRVLTQKPFKGVIIPWALFPNNAKWWFSSRMIWGFLESEKKRNPTQRFVFCPPDPPSRFFVFAFFLHFEEKNSPNTKNFWGSRPLQKVDSGMGFLVKSLCLGVFLALNFWGPEFRTS